MEKRIREIQEEIKNLNEEIKIAEENGDNETVENLQQALTKREMQLAGMMKLEKRESNSVNEIQEEVKNLNEEIKIAEENGDQGTAEILKETLAKKEMQLAGMMKKEQEKAVNLDKNEAEKDEDKEAKENNKQNKSMKEIQEEIKQLKEEAKIAEENGDYIASGKLKTMINEKRALILPQIIEKLEKQKEEAEKNGDYMAMGKIDEMLADKKQKLAVMKKNEIMKEIKDLEKQKKEAEKNDDYISAGKLQEMIDQKNNSIKNLGLNNTFAKKNQGQPINASSELVTHINFNAKEGKYEYYKIDSNKNIVEERSVEAKKISFFEMRKIRKNLKEKCREYAEDMDLDKDAFDHVVKLIDPNVFNLLDDNEKVDYINSLDNLKEWKKINDKKIRKGEKPELDNNEFKGAINYDMRGFKNLKSMTFFEKRRLNKIAKKQNKIDFATYQSDKKKNKRLTAALLATGIAVGGSMIGNDSAGHQSIEDKNPTPNQEKQVDNKENKEQEIKVGIGDSATLENGTYYYDSNKTDPKGEIKDLQNKDVKIRYVAVKNSDGTTKVYNEKDDINIADLQKNAPDSEIFVSVGNVEKEGMTNYDDLGWMDYKDVSQAFEKVEKDEILADNKDTKTIDLSDGKSKMEIGKNGNVKVVIPQSINDTVEQIKGTNEQNSSRKDFQEQLRKGVNNNSKLSDFMIQDNQQQQQKTQNQKTQDDDGSRQ